MTVLIVVIGAPLSVLAFTEPLSVPFDYPPQGPLQQPGTAVAPPLNTSATTQTKPGRLNVLGSTDLWDEDSLTGGSVAAQQFCIYPDFVPGDCITDWSALSGQFVRLRDVPTPPPDPDWGFAAVSATTGQISAFTAEGDQLVGGTPQSSGALGQSASNITAGASAGVMGIAGNAGFTLRHYGIYGAVLGAPTLSYSGYFKGRVKVNDQLFFFPSPEGAYTLKNQATVNIDSTAGSCSGNPTVACTTDPDCAGAGTCVFGGLALLHAGGNILQIAARTENCTDPGGLCYDVDATTNPLELRVSGGSAINVQDDVRINPAAPFRWCSGNLPQYDYQGDAGEEGNAAGIVLGSPPERFCRNTWPADGTSAFWQADTEPHPDPDSIYPEQMLADEDLMAGDAVAGTAPFRVDVVNAADATVLVKGTGPGWGETEGRKMVIGNPVAGDPYTCGDGICNGSDTLATCGPPNGDCFP